MSLINNQNNFPTIKIIILDLYPSYSELNPTNEEMLLIFEGINIYFYLKDLLTSHQKIEIKNNNQSSISISIIKTNNILASGYINFKHGEQWVTMNSDNKKKSNMNLALNLIDCIKLKIFCDMKNVNKSGVNSNNTNANSNSFNITNLNNSVNLTNRNINKAKQKINQINLKISKKNTINKMLTKGSPKKINMEIYGTRRSPKASINTYNKIKYTASEILNKNELKYNNSNFNTLNHQNSIKNSNTAFSTINKHTIKKIDINSSNKTRNSNLEKKSPTKFDYSSLRVSNNHNMRKINTSAFNLNNINKNKKSKMTTPDIEIKELHNVRKLGGSPKLNHKNKLNEDIYLNIGKSGDKKFHKGTKSIRNLNLDKNYLSKNYINDNDNNKKSKSKNKNNFSKNILNINYENNNNIINMNILNNINDIQGKINKNNFINFNNTYGNNFNKQDLKNKILYPTEPNQIFTNQSYNYMMDKNINSLRKTEFERSLNSFEDYDDDKKINNIKDNNKISEKIGVYTNKRLNIKKNKTQINKKKNEKSSNLEIILTQNTEENLDDKEENEIKEEKKINENKIDEETIKVKRNESEDIFNIDENSNFERIKEDFLLLYNENYMNNIQEDLLKLEIELIFEKIVELMECYNIEYNEKKMEKEIIQNNFKLNLIEYKKIQKLIKKLEISKIDNEINNKIKKYKDKNDYINVRKSEIEVFKNFYKDNEKNKNILKNIFSKIIHNKNNPNIINLIDNEKLELLLNANTDHNNTNKISTEKKLLSPVYQKNNIKYIPK